MLIRPVYSEPNHNNYKQGILGHIQGHEFMIMCTFSQVSRPKNPTKWHMIQLQRQFYFKSIRSTTYESYTVHPSPWSELLGFPCSLSRPSWKSYYRVSSRTRSLKTYVGCSPWRNYFGATRFWSHLIKGNRRYAKHIKFFEKHNPFCSVHRAVMPD